MGKKEKLNAILVCPGCRSKSLKFDKLGVVCQCCMSEYPVVENTPLLLKHGSPFRARFFDKAILAKRSALKNRIKQLLKTPEPRIWSRKSKQIIISLLERVNPDHPDHIVVNVGTGLEKVFHEAFSPYSDLLRIGLPHTGKVDAFGDAMDFPIDDSSIDLLFSSSVIEHLANPELAVHEIYRVLKPGGIVYAEIPFLRAYHMAPLDYQRYTIAGIESLFARQGFEVIEKGISSGPFTALALFIRDFAVTITPGRVASFLVRIVTSWLVQPIKYLDWFVESHEWSSYLACNFFYAGQKR